MLRLLIIPFLSLYLFAAAGLQVQLHYCGSELASWALYASQPGGCEDEQCEDEPYNPDPCCSNEWIEAGLVNSYYTHSQENWEASTQGQGNFFPDSDLGYLSSIPALVDWGHPQIPSAGLRQVPMVGLLPLYTLHSQFLFYG